MAKLLEVKGLRTQFFTQDFDTAHPIAAGKNRRW